MNPLVYTVSQYQLLEGIATYVSAKDLFSLSLTCSDMHELILKPTTVFNKLKRLTLCDGSGLRETHQFCEPQAKCQANTLPCEKCNINVCEPCRWKASSECFFGRRPNLNTAWENQNIVCFCDECDPFFEARASATGKVICDCDVFARWVCHQCRKLESEGKRVVLQSIYPMPRRH